MTMDTSDVAAAAGSDNTMVRRFHWIDYVVFSFMLIASAATGIYYGYCRKKPSLLAAGSSTDESSPADHRNRRHPRSGNVIASATGRERAETSDQMSEYLLGSRMMKPFPVAMSLIASYISGVTILGTPTEIYQYGTQYWLIVVAIFACGTTVVAVYLPVFSHLRVTSSYEYLELRFSSRVRTLASVMFVLDEIMFLPIIIYVPALAFNQVTGVNIYIIGSIVCMVCIIYTILGGMKAVVFTDAWQVAVMYVAVVVIVVIGTVSMKGPIAIFDEAAAGGRLQIFNFSPSLYERHTFWGVLIGGFSYWLSFNSVNQTMVQRYMALPNERQARLSIIFYTIGISLFVSTCCYAGVLTYAYFAHCDPEYAGHIQTSDQLFPLFVMEAVGDIRGLPGLFIAGVFGAALSSLSVVLNSTAAVILEDILKGSFGWRHMSARLESFIVKSTIAVLGVVSMLLMFVVEQMGGVLVVATSLSAIAAGTSFGVFTLGMLVPRSNQTGAVCGMVAGALMSGWVSLGTQIAAATKAVTPHRLGVKTDECAVPGGNSTFWPDYPDESGVFPLYRLSFHWINPIGVLTVLLVGTSVSYASGATDWAQVDARLISPVLHRWLPAKCFEMATKAQRNNVKSTEAAETVLSMTEMTEMLSSARGAM